MTRRSKHNWSGLESEIDTLSAIRLEDYIYQDSGLLDSINIITPSPSGLEVIRASYLYDYDSFHNIEKIRTFQLQELQGLDTMVLVEETKYSHNQIGQLEYMVTYSEFQNVPWTAVDSTHYTYDSNGHLITKVEYEGRVENLQFPDYIYNYKNYPTGAPDTIDIRRHKNIDSIQDSRFLELYEAQSSGDPGNMRAQYWRDSLYFGIGYGYFQTNDSIIRFEDVIYPSLFEEYFGKWENMIIYEEAYNNYRDGQRPIEHIKYRSFAREYFYTKLETSTVDIEPDISKELQVFPNPTSDLIHINHYNISKGSKVDLIIVDHEGRTIRAEKHPMGNPISVSGLSEGVYYFFIEDGSEKFIGRFVRI